MKGWAHESDWGARYEIRKESIKEIRKQEEEARDRWGRCAYNISVPPCGALVFPVSRHQAASNFLLYSKMSTPCWQLDFIQPLLSVFLRLSCLSVCSFWSEQRCIFIMTFNSHVKVWLDPFGAMFQDRTATEPFIFKIFKFCLHIACYLTDEVKTSIIYLFIQPCVFVSAHITTHMRRSEPE